MEVCYLFDHRGDPGITRFVGTASSLLAGMSGFFFYSDNLLILTGIPRQTLQQSLALIFIDMPGDTFHFGVAKGLRIQFQLYLDVPVQKRRLEEGLKTS